MLADRRFGQRAARLDREESERAQRLVLGRHGSLEDPLRDHALGEVVPALEVLATGDHELAAVPERIEHHLRGLPVPHAAAALPFEVARAERSFGADALEDRLDEVRMVAERTVVRAPVAAALHDEPEVRPQLDREQARLVGPVLEDPSFAEQRRHDGLRERADARRQREVVRAVDGRRSSRAALPTAGGSRPRPRLLRRAGTGCESLPADDQPSDSGE